MPLDGQVLSRDIWIEIATFLTYGDLLSVRSCSTWLNKVITSDEVWRPICEQRWLKNDYKVFANYRKRAETNGFKCLFDFFKYRNHIDETIVKTLRKLGQGDDDIRHYWDSFRSLMDYGDLIMPLLTENSRNGYTGTHGAHGPHNESFEFTFLANQLLTAMQHGLVFDLINCCSGDATTLEWVHYAEETVFLPFSALDLSFNLLLPHRSSCFNEVNDALHQSFKNWSEFKSLPSTLKVDRVMKHLFQVLTNRRNPQWDSLSRFYLDDFFLLRVYAGEARGHPLVLLAIIQAFASFYGIEAILCEEFLIVRDEKVRSGQTYITVSQAGRPRIFTQKGLIESMCRIFPSRQAVLNTVIPRLCQPLKTKSLLTKLFDEWYPYCKKSYWKALPGRRCDLLSKAMPHSLTPASPAVYEYAQAYWKINQLPPHPSFRAVGKARFASYILEQFPHDYPLLQSLKFISDSQLPKVPKDIKVKLFSTKYLITEGSIEDTGKFAIDSRNEQQSYIVIATKNSENGNTYYMLLDFLGEIIVSLKEDFRLADKTTSDAIWHKMRQYLNFSDLGLFFTRYDQTKCRLVPSNSYAEYLKA
ncbi:LAMI_0A03268g1_1 [Lachancea mirantina]|uniref:LAMI_0A03268g1_1 n=1 Tax=Lachancea mirantina TaxID=1230905 RepID=A0A1G4IN82_9SACH|nr:LAMI_0A03268g1_1 [Lachancea mirantina]